jgi:hypothetical protein
VNSLIQWCLCCCGLLIPVPVRPDIGAPSAGRLTNDEPHESNRIGEESRAHGCAPNRQIVKKSIEESGRCPSRPGRSLSSKPSQYTNMRTPWQEDTQNLAGREIVRVYVDKGYRVTMPRILVNYLMTLVRVVGPGRDVFWPNRACLVTRHGCNSFEGETDLVGRY